MTLIIMYALMIFDLMMTLIYHEDAGELNPMFARILIGQPLYFIYLKLAFNSAAALGIVVLHKYKPILGQFFIILGIIIYGFVGYMHIEIYRLLNNQAPLIPAFTRFIDKIYY